MLVMVMIVTAVGLLFGAGALLLFRYQCQQRIDRQHEMEKVYAVRSALNYATRFTGAIGDSGLPFRYYTGSDRDLGLLVKPVAAIFPDENDSRHFDMQKAGHLTFSSPQTQYNNNLDYEYGVDNWTNIEISAKHGELYGLAFNDLAATNGVKWWFNIGMRGTGGWLQEDYGRRYCFWPREYVRQGTSFKDVVRLCIIRNVTNEHNNVGRKHGWPLSMEGERALVLEIRPIVGDTDSNAEIAFYEYRCTGGAIIRSERYRWYGMPEGYNMGMQIADDKVSVFYISNKGLNTINNASDRSKIDSLIGSLGYTFLEIVSGSQLVLTPETYRYFADSVVLDGVSYGGVCTNGYGKIQAPELRAVFEVEAASDLRGPGVQIEKSNVDFITRFRVTPAYQYDVFIEHPHLVTNRATVAQKIGEYSRYGDNYRMLTYDTHGTEHKGFRRDEREAERRGR